MKSINVTISVIIVSSLLSCATIHPPSQQLTETETVIRQAEQIGASEYAPLTIREAKKKLELARAAYEREDFEEARRLAEQSKVDAELAQIQTLSGKTQKAVRELREGIRILQEELSSSNNR